MSRVYSGLSYSTAAKSAVATTPYTSIQRNSFGEVISYVEDGVTVTVGRDSQGRISTLTSSRGVLTYTYDPDTGAITSVA